MLHRTHDRISLEMATRVGCGLIEHPEWIALARLNLERWSRRNHNAPGLLRCYAEWRELLELPIDEVAAILMEESDRGQRLRQNSPFVGILTPAEVWEIKRRAYDARTA
jgi:hypothetical protein